MGDQEISEDLHSDEQSADGRFFITTCTIRSTLNIKARENLLRRWSKYFILQNEDLYYIGGGELKSTVSRTNTFASYKAC